ncbi:imm11 family protein [Aliikangiella sp. G2MR2-5]|uniref:imm11 family protein n=1 Tax=Aliikangiella sp. G2MR2-5 TaxID=2788943 RepID=UPI0018A8ABFD|nr:DUF1629 domain-containing protein [Aliikangiella sp. G2MR2-5]
MYYILKNNLLLDTDYRVNEPSDISEDISFMKGSVINQKIEQPIIYSTDATHGAKMLDFKDCSFPLMSEKFVSLLQEAGVDNLQLFPAIVKSDVDGTIWDNYFAVNILGVIQCADLSNSIYSELMPGSYIFDELAIDAEKANDALLFRLYEDKATIIIHRDVGRHVKSQDPDKKLLGWTVGKIIQ